MKIKVEEAVGMVLAHDITEIRRGEYKGPAFRKGHRVEEADICRLQRLGKRHLYVLEIKEDYLHEDDAAVAMADGFRGEGVIRRDEPREGKVNLVAARDGLLKVDAEAMIEVNLLGEVRCASRHTNSPGEGRRVGCSPSRHPPGDPIRDNRGSRPDSPVKRRSFSREALQEGQGESPFYDLD